MKKQLIAKLLVLAMVLAMVPATVLAASAGDNTNYGYYSVAVDTTTATSAPTTVVNAGDITVENGETTIEAKVVNGEAVVSLNAKAIEKLFENVEGDAVVLKIEAEGATTVGTSLPGKALAAAAEKSGSSTFSVQLGEVATITIPNEALATVFKDLGNVKISASNSGTNVGFSIQTSGKTITSIKGLKVEF